MEPTDHTRTVNAKHINRRLRSRRASRLTNGSTLVLKPSKCTDGRSAWCRRLRDLLEMHVSDLGGYTNISAAEMALLRRAITLIVELERREAEFAQLGRAGSDDTALIIYSTTTNTLRRTLEALGLHRRARDVSPTLSEYLKAAALKAEEDEAERGIIDGTVEETSS
jgi:hypothetical protein